MKTIYKFPGCLSLSKSYNPFIDAHFVSVTSNRCFIKLLQSFQVWELQSVFKGNHDLKH